MSPEHPQLTLRFESLDALEAELEANLGSGRAFVPGATGISERQRCELLLVHPTSGESIGFDAEVVWAQSAGVGLQLQAFDAEARERLTTFVSGVEPKPAPAPEQNLYARVRRYSVSEQLRAAREADHAERVALEQIYGKAVWEVLIRNPRITAAELTKLARDRRITKPIIDAITGNAGWLASSELRRSLLMNPKVTGSAMDKVLRAMPKLELTRLCNQTSFPMSVRQAAKRLQGRA